MDKFHHFSSVAQTVEVPYWTKHTSNEVRKVAARMNAIFIVLSLALVASSSAFFSGSGRWARSGSKLSMASSFGVQKLGK